ncbi:MAG: cysteine desulfurase [Anaerolineales bacterium]|nr:cysteine desulfurase [Anaerolineales bacterium]
MQKPSTYLDYAASTPVEPRVLDAMLPYFSEQYGNPSAVHIWGQKAENAVERSREKIATILDCKPNEIVFTSCGSESDNLALRGVALEARETKNARHILITPVEHHAVLNTAKDLEHLHGFEVEFLEVDSLGLVSPEDLTSKIRSDTALVSIIFANNEIGTINDVHALGDICQSKNVPLHTDAVQAASQLSMKVNELNVQLLSLGAHKFYGPKGIGALYVRSGINISPSQTGGGQEFGLRAGTSNVPLIVGMAEAFEITNATRTDHNEKYRKLRDRLLSSIPNLVPDSRITGHPIHRLPNHASFVFRGVDGNQLLAALDAAGFGCSSGSACKTGDPTPSDVLLAIGLPAQWALGSLRVTVGRSTQDEDIEHFLGVLPAIIEQLRKVNS